MTIKKKEIKHAHDEEKTITIKKKKERKWKTQINIKHLAFFFRYFQFGPIDK